MSSRKRRRGDSGSPGSDTDEDTCRLHDQGKVTKIKSVSYGTGSANFNVTGDVHNMHRHVTFEDEKGDVRKLETVIRQQRMMKAQERANEPTQTPLSEEEVAQRRQAEEQKRQAEAAERLEQRRQTHIDQTGEDISTADFKRMEEHDTQERRQSGRSSTDAKGQTRIHAYFRPKSGVDAVASHQSEVNTIVERLDEVQVPRDSEERGHPALTSVTSVTPTDEQTRMPAKMYLRLAFLKKDEIDKMNATPADDEIRKTQMIGPVSVEELVGETAVKVDSSQFKEMRSNIIAFTFKALNKALENADWKVDRKYLSQRYRRGVNNDWTPAQVMIIIEAVEQTSGNAGEVKLTNATRFLTEKYGKFAGYEWRGITRDKVKYVYKNREKLLSESGKPKLGRPRLLSSEYEKALNDFIRKTLARDTSCRLSYYMDELDEILTAHGKADAFYDACKDPPRYFRQLIRDAGGSPRQVTTYGGKELSNEDRLTHTRDNFLRLAYLVQKYGLTKNDVFNFDETAVRFHEDATGKVIAPKGTQVVKGEAFEGSLDHRLCCTFIPMVNCGGEKFDPALIFKGTKHKTGAIPGNKEGFKAFQGLYDPDGKGKVCFMQNRGKWSTNETMTKWFTEHFIPQVQAAKEARREAQETAVPSKYVVILDGVSTHCLSETTGPPWITQVQQEDPNLVLLWLPPNMTGDLQPLDVNFNRPFKARYRPEVGSLKLKQREEKAEQESTDGQGITRREDSAAQKLKEAVIKAIITAYKSVPKDQIEKGWTKAGKFVYQDNEVPDHGAGYHSAWDPDTQSQAVARFNAGSLFYKDMKGGITDVGGPGFIPRAGRKKKQTAEEAPPRPAPSVDSVTSSEHAEDAEYSEYGSSQCPDEFINAEGEEDEIIEGLGTCQSG